MSAEHTSGALNGRDCTSKLILEVSVPVMLKQLPKSINLSPTFPLSAGLHNTRCTLLALQRLHQLDRATMWARCYQTTLGMFSQAKGTALEIGAVLDRLGHMMMVMTLAANACHACDVDKASPAGWSIRMFSGLMSAWTTPLLCIRVRAPCRCQCGVTIWPHVSAYSTAAYGSRMCKV